MKKVVHVHPSLDFFRSVNTGSPGRARIKILNMATGFPKTWAFRAGECMFLPVFMHENAQFWLFSCSINDKMQGSHQFSGRVQSHSSNSSTPSAVFLSCETASVQRIGNGSRNPDEERFSLTEGKVPVRFTACIFPAGSRTDRHEGSRIPDILACVVTPKGCWLIFAPKKTMTRR